MSDTNKAAENLYIDLSTDWGTQAFGAEVGTIAQGASVGSQLASQAQNLIPALGQQFAYIGQNVANIFTDSTQYERLADAAGSAALNYLDEKVQRVKLAWKTPATVTVGALWGEVAPFAKNPTVAFKELKNKFGNIKNYLITDILGFESTDLKGILGEASSSIISDPSVVSAISSLSAVTATASTLNTLANSIEVIKRIINILEPLLQTAEILSNTGLVFAWGAWGVTAGEMAADITSATEEASQKITAIALNTFREFVFNIKIQVPSLLLGALKTISVKEAVTTWGDGWSENARNWANAVFSQDFYNDVTADLIWTSTIKDTLNQWGEKIDNWSLFDLGGEQSEIMKSKFLQTLTQDVMAKALKQARANAGIITYKDGIGWVSTANITNAYSANHSIAPIPWTFEKETPEERALTQIDKLLTDDVEQSPLIVNGELDEESIRIISGKIIDIA